MLAIAIITITNTNTIIFIISVTRIILIINIIIPITQADIVLQQKRRDAFTLAITTKEVCTA
jgi:hypothetical protein